MTTASQHLRALCEAATPGPSDSFPKGFAESVAIIRALPALIAAIEAAEAVDSEYDPKSILALPEDDKLHDALAALREQLEANA